VGWRWRADDRSIGKVVELGGSLYKLYSGKRGCERGRQTLHTTVALQLISSDAGRLSS